MTMPTGEESTAIVPATVLSAVLRSETELELVLTTQIVLPSGDGAAARGANPTLTVETTAGEALPFTVRFGSITATSPVLTLVVYTRLPSGETASPAG